MVWQPYVKDQGKNWKCQWQRVACFDFLTSMYEVQFYKSSYYSRKQMALLFGLKYYTQNFKYLPYKNTLTNFTQICLHSSRILS